MQCLVDVVQEPKVGRHREDVDNLYWAIQLQVEEFVFVDGRNGDKHGELLTRAVARPHKIS